MTYLITTVEDVDHTLCVSVAFIADVRGAVVYHSLIDGVRGLVREDAGRQAGHKLFNFVDPATLHDVVIDEDVLTKKFHLVLEVAEQTAHLLEYKYHPLRQGMA